MVEDKSVLQKPNETFFEDNGSLNENESLLNLS